jgi:osmoprotectant transport system permease protein
MDTAWVLDHVDELAVRTLQHLWLAAVAVGVGFAVSMVLSIVAVRVRSTLAPILSIAGILYTIPSLALFAALVPVTGLSLPTAEVPLVLYTLLIFIRNIVAGLDGVPADVVEAADGMGYSGRTRLLRVELPLAVPLVVAGIRLASVSTIGLVTISGIIGDRFGGLGFFIFEGYRHSFTTEILAGAVPSVILALAVDRALVAVGARLTPWATAGTRP